MKTSQIALLSLGGIVVGIIAVAAVIARIALGWSDPVDIDPGEMLTTTTDLTGFSAIELDGRWRVDVRQGDEWRVELSYPENLEVDFDASVRDESLRLEGSSSGSFFGGSDASFAAEIVMPILEELEVAGGSRVTLSGFEGPRLVVEIAGAAQLTGENGRYETLDLSAAGANDIQLDGIVFTHANVDLAGASNVALTMDGGELSGSMAGAGRIEYAGTVSREMIEIAGFGQVGPVDP